MPFVVTEENTTLGTTVTLPGQETTAQKAFNRAIESFGAWIRSGWNWNSNSPRQRDGVNYGDAAGPAPGGKFKAVIDTTSMTDLFIHAQWQSFNGARWDSHNIFWRVVEV